MTSVEVDPYPILKSEDAYELGRLVSIGLALPNETGLWTPARELSPEEISGETVQYEEARLWQAAEDIARIASGTFGGLAHSQLHQPEGRQPLQMMLAATEVPGAKTQGFGKFTFSLLYNASFNTQDSEGRASGVMEIDEGCFSSANVWTKKTRAAVVYDVKGLNSDGEPVGIEAVSGYGAVSLQHERDHGRAIRAADEVGKTRDLVSPSEIAAHQQAAAAGRTRSPRISQAGWYDLSRNPDYDFFSTPELRDAFEAGKAGDSR